MNALSQALEASQSKAVAALGKAYVRRDETPDATLHELDDETLHDFVLVVSAFAEDLQREERDRIRSPLS